ncbi:MAG: hypothetical protein ACOYOF_20410 [Verrucomicrobiaceae bacterium]
MSSALGEKNLGKSFGAETIAGQTQAVVADGVGKTENDALKDAFRNAVQQVVGLVLDADVLVRNDAVIRDQVLTYSDGFVHKYDVLSQRIENGLTHVRISAVVEHRSLVEKLEAKQVISKPSDMRHLFAKAVTEIEAVSNATVLLKERLVEFHKVWTASPGEARYDREKRKLILPIMLHADKTAFGATLSRLEILLKRIAIQKSSCSAFSVEQIGSAETKGIISGSGSAVRMVFGRLVRREPNHRRWEGGLLRDSGIQPRGGPESSSGVTDGARDLMWFWIGGPPESPRGYAVEVAFKELNPILMPTWTLHVALLNHSGGIIAENLRNTLNMNDIERRKSGFFPLSNHGHRAYLPLFLQLESKICWLSSSYMDFSTDHPVNDGYGHSAEAISFIDACQTELTFDLPAESLKDIVDMKIKLSLTESPPHDW